MSKLQDLIKSLKAHTVLIIENDITHEDNPVKLLIRFSQSNDNVKQLIINDIEESEYNVLAKAIADFNQLFFPLLTNNEAVQKFLPGAYLDRFLKEVNKEELLKDKVFDEFKAALEKDRETHSLKAIFLKYGIYSGIKEEHYSQLLSELKGVEEVEILYYKSTPGTTNEKSFFSDIEKSVERTKSNFCLAIIDKVLGTGDGDEAGKTFIIDDLVDKYKDTPKLRFIGCLYTSRPDAEKQELTEYKDYFIQEISKDSKDVLGEMSRNLAQSAFAEVFNSLRNKKLESAQEAFDLVLKNQKNIKFIIDESHKEGIPPYDAVKYWFDLAKQERFDKKELEDYKFIAGLTAFFKQEYLDDHPNISEIGEELRSLNTYELYDYNVNKKYLPIAPGDIWESNGEYYILMGQLCDLLLRKEKIVDGKKIPNQRNAKVGELINIKAVDNSEGKKYSINSKENKKLVFIEHFIDFLDDKIKAIQIDISTPFIHFADLQVLDLAMFNDNGICELAVGEELDEKIKLVLSERKDEYYDHLKEYYSEDRLKNIKLLAGKLGFNEPLDFSKLKFEESEGKINHGIRRVCRLKGRYFDSLYNNYLNTKGRIDLNLIDNSPEIVTKTKVKYQLANDETTTKEVEISKYENRGGKYFVKTEVLEAFGEPYVTLLSSHKKNTVDITENGLLKITEEGEEILIQFCYQTINKKPIDIDKTDLGYLEIFQGQKSRYENKVYIIDDGNGEQKIFNNDSRIAIDELKAGIIIHELNERVSIINGIITKENIEE